MTAIAICVPTVDAKVRIEFSASLAALFGMASRFFVLAIIHESGSIISRVRNRCLEHIEEIEKDSPHHFEWIFFIDSDMRFPPSTLTRLYQHVVEDQERRIVGCTYLKRSPPYNVHGKGLDGVPQELDGAGLLKVAALPTGMLLVSRDVFAALKRPYFRLPFREESALGAGDHMEYGEDFYFCAAARAAGFYTWLDTELTKEIGHVSEKVLYPDKEPWSMTCEEANTIEGMQRQILDLQQRIIDHRNGHG